MIDADESQPWHGYFAASDQPCFLLAIEPGPRFVQIAINAVYEQATGLTAADVIGREPRELLPPEVAEIAEERLRRCLNRGHAAVYEEEIAFPSGPRCWRTMLVPWPADNPRYLLGLAHDLTESRRAERALRESEARYRRLAENAPDIIYRLRLRPTRVLEYVNPAIERILGTTPEEHYRDPGLLGRLLHPDDAALVSDEGLIRAGSPVLMRWRSRDGQLVWLETRQTPVLDDDGQVVAVEGVARDVTAQRLREDERRAFEQTLLETQKLESLGVLAGGIAHDFNNLLTGILGFVTLTRAAPLDTPELDTNLGHIERAAMQAADLCRQLLAYSGKGRFSVRPVDLSALVRDSAALLNVSITKSARLKLELATGLPAIAADATQLRQVVMNLVINASEALGEGGGNITVVTGSLEADREYLASTFLAPELPEGRYVFLEVGDTGSGMSEQTRARIFDPFFTTKFTGRGLGLSAVLGIVRGHGGAIKVYSEPGRGTTFKLLFPAVTEAAEPLPGTSRLPAPTAARRGTVLVIDDEPVVREVAARMLRTLGYDVLQAPDGPSGLEHLRSSAPEVMIVLLDLTMPGLDGQAVFREIHHLRPDLPVLLMSGYNEQDAVSRFTGKGLAGFLQKPFTLDELARRLPHRE